MLKTTNTETLSNQCLSRKIIFEVQHKLYFRVFRPHRRPDTKSSSLSRAKGNEVPISIFSLIIHMISNSISYPMFMRCYFSSFSIRQFSQSKFSNVIPKARFKRRILHVPNLMQLSENNRFFSFALDSARVKCDV